MKNLALSVLVAVQAACQTVDVQGRPALDELQLVRRSFYNSGVCDSGDAVAYGANGAVQTSWELGKRVLVRNGVPEITQQSNSDWRGRTYQTPDSQYILSSDGKRLVKGDFSQTIELSDPVSQNPLFKASLGVEFVDDGDGYFLFDTLPFTFGGITAPPGAIRLLYRVNLKDGQPSLAAAIFEGNGGWLIDPRIGYLGTYQFDPRTAVVTVKRVDGQSETVTVPFLPRITVQREASVMLDRQPFKNLGVRTVKLDSSRMALIEDAQNPVSLSGLLAQSTGDGGMKLSEPLGLVGRSRLYAAYRSEPDEAAVRIVRSDGRTIDGRISNGGLRRVGQACWVDNFLTSRTSFQTVVSSSDELLAYHWKLRGKSRKGVVFFSGGGPNSLSLAENEAAILFYIAQDFEVVLLLAEQSWDNRFYLQFRGRDIASNSLIQKSDYLAEQRAIVLRAIQDRPGCVIAHGDSLGLVVLDKVLSDIPLDVLISYRGAADVQGTLNVVAADYRRYNALAFYDDVVPDTTATAKVTLAIHGDRDLVVPPAQVARRFSTPNARIVYFHGGHVPFEPDALDGAAKAVVETVAVCRDGN